MDNWAAGKLGQTATRSAPHSTQHHNMGTDLLIDKVGINNLSPDQDTTNWTVAYTGWNVNAEIIANQFRVRAKGSAGKTVTWSAAITFIEA